MLTKILLIVLITALIIFTVSAVILWFIRSLAKSKKIVNLTLTKVLIKKCDKKPNKLMVFTCKDGSILTVKYQPKVEK